MWTDNRIDWKDCDTSTGQFHFTPRPIWEEPVYRNGKRLKKNQQRPDPFWLNFIDLLLLRLLLPPVYNNMVILNQIFRMKLCGAYSRKYDKPRKFRKKRIF